MNDDERIVDQIVRKHGEVLNLRENPGVIIDILRRFGSVVGVDDGGLPPGGVPEPPPPPPGPSSRGFEGLRLEDLMKEVLRLSRAVDELHAKLDARQAGA